MATDETLTKINDIICEINIQFIDDQLCKFNPIKMKGQAIYVILFEYFKKYTANCADVISLLKELRKQELEDDTTTIINILSMMIIKKMMAKRISCQRTQLIPKKEKTENLNIKVIRLLEKNIRYKLVNIRNSFHTLLFTRVDIEEKEIDDIEIEKIFYLRLVYLQKSKIIMIVNLYNSCVVLNNIIQKKCITNARNKLKYIIEQKNTNNYIIYLCEI
ncbi:hypothetical protein RFI_34982 [Reticulomyxa filosa]|uniref:Uncharacterized protein n=1 Tax=Reticulomyxa filosa TaxID=46433 RepID=X6LLH1_RETFI|nr:hypothetical protein RFI_34982 [Reticulomyxa filosa]|eukprot:ETO02449.1 hypothetical protein RFI_34982 [Reticulomyxa filosa]